MGLLDDLQNKASELLGGSDIAGSAADAASGAQDAAQGATDSLQGLSADMQEQITQYAEEHNISIEAAREHFLPNS